VAGACAARAAGTQEERPARKAARPVPHEDTAVPVIEREDGRWLLVRRPADARLGGMWSFPAEVRGPRESVGAAAERAAREGLGVVVAAGEEVAVVPHAFTHVRATYRAVRCRLVSGQPAPLRYDAVAWASPAELDGYALPVAQRKIAALAATPTLFSAG
jgi:A/G-specific adenine glycosylase